MEKSVVVPVIFKGEKYCGRKQGVGVSNVNNEQNHPTNPPF